MIEASARGYLAEPWPYSYLGFPALGVTFYPRVQEYYWEGTIYKYGNPLEMTVVWWSWFVPQLRTL